MLRIDHFPAELLENIVIYLSPKYTKRFIQSSKRVKHKLQNHYKILKIIEKFDFKNEFLSLLHKPEYQKYYFEISKDTSRDEIESSMKRRMIRFASIQAMYSKEVRKLHSRYPELYKIILRDTNIDLTTDDETLGRVCFWGHIEIVELLLKNGADPSAMDNAAIRMAAKNGHSKIVHLLMRDQRVDASDQNNLCIQWAASNGHNECVKLLLRDPRVDPSVNDNLCIKRSAENGHLDVVNQLKYDPRVDPAAEDNYAIGLASYKGHVEIVRSLLQDPRVDPSACDNYAIKKAAKRGHRQVVELLLKDKRVVLSLSQVASLVTSAENNGLGTLWNETKAAILMK